MPQHVQAGSCLDTTLDGMTDMNPGWQKYQPILILICVAIAFIAIVHGGHTTPLIAVPALCAIIILRILRWRAVSLPLVSSNRLPSGTSIRRISKWLLIGALGSAIVLIGALSLGPRLFWLAEICVWAFSLQTVLLLLTVLGERANNRSSRPGV